MKDAALVLIKPDGMRKGIVGEVMREFLSRDLELIGLKMVQVPRKLAAAHYNHLRDQFFFKEIVAYLTGQLHEGAAVVAMVFSGPNAITQCRAVAGATNPEEAHPRSVRGKFGRVTTKGVFENLVHVSSDPKEATREIQLWFKKSELIQRRTH